MNKFKLYPDCKLVRGISRAAIYDFTRNDIFLVPKNIADLFVDEQINLDDVKDVDIKELKEFLIDNELGRFNLTDELIHISEEIISAGAITNAIIDVDNNTNHLNKVACELSDLLCESVSLRFAEDVPIENILSSCNLFTDISISNLEICITHSDNIDELIECILSNISICSRIIVMNSPTECTKYKANDIVVRYVKAKMQYNLCCDSELNFSQYANASLTFYNESRKFNNCLYKKVYIDNSGNISNCPMLNKVFGNISDNTISSVIELNSFKVLWFITKDDINKCSDCELRYACHNCIFLNHKCTYNVYE